MDISENSALFVYPEARRSGNAPGRPRRQTGRRRASAGSYRHGGLKLKYSGIGGQAVLEGIMMKNKDTYATCLLYTSSRGDHIHILGKLLLEHGQAVFAKKPF